MANEPPQNHGPDPQPGKTPELELDDILSQATTLAADLNEQLGGADVPPASPAPDPLNEVKASTSDSLECELQELERLVASTSKEIAPEPSKPRASGGAESSDPASPPAAPAPAPSKANAYVAPDFMAEFTQPAAPVSEPAASLKRSPPTPAAPSPSPSAASSSATSLSPKPGVVSTGKIGVVGAPSRQPPEGPAPSLPEEKEPPTENEPLPERPPRLAMAARLESILLRLRPTALAWGAQGVRLLEAIDRPFSRIGLVPRRLAGWLAIATLGTASIVYVLSLW